ncbi:kinase-like protein [Wilcoxina mikolae CBS 423.85]|nr:kinase-like protein [Wilcoxina mikolae CBS 423.85]
MDKLSSPTTPYCISTTSTAPPCPVCGFDTSFQNSSDYTATLKVFYGCSDRGVWSIGTDKILKERPATSPMTEGKILTFLKQHTTIPVPTVYHEWIATNGKYFILLERMPGQTLEAAWPTLENEEKRKIVEKTGIDGGPVYNDFLFFGTAPHGPMSSNDEIWEAMSAGVNMGLSRLSAKARADIRDSMPKCDPFTLTHGDLADVNIMVHEGRLSGIIDWELAGYFPVWWEFAAAGIGLGGSIRSGRSI